MMASPYSIVPYRTDGPLLNSVTKMYQIIIINRLNENLKIRGKK